MAKHILILTTTNDFLLKFERENVKILQSLGYTVHYASNMNEPHYISDRERIEQMGVQTHHIDIARSPFLFSANCKALKQLLSLIRRHDIRAIHCHTPVGGLLGRLAGKLFKNWKLIVIYTAHGFHFYKGAPLINHLAYYPVERLLARWTDILIVINSEDYQAARKFHLKGQKLLYQIPGVGLDREAFKPLTPDARQALRKKSGLAPDEFFLLSVGELNENKNQKIVLDALFKIKQCSPMPQKVRYGICGDGFFRSQIERWIAQLGLSDTVEVYGYCFDVPENLACADAAVLPSKREGLGMAGLEALAMGVPLIAADNRGTREYMKDGINGYVCDFDNVECFIEAIRQLQMLSPESRAKMRSNCIASAEPFDKTHSNAIMQKIYSDVACRLEGQAHEQCP